MLLGFMRGVSALLFVLFFAATCAAGQPEDPVGSWKLQSLCPDGKIRSCVVTVSREGDGMKASYAADGETRPAKAVSFSDGILTLNVDGKYGGQTYGLVYAGKPKDGKIKGTVTWSYQWFSGSFDFEGERVESSGDAGASVAAEAPEQDASVCSAVSSFFSKSLTKVKSWKAKLGDWKDQLGGMRERVASVFRCSRFHFTAHKRFGNCVSLWRAKLHERIETRLGSILPW